MTSRIRFRAWYLRAMEKFLIAFKEIFAESLFQPARLSSAADSRFLARSADAVVDWDSFPASYEGWP